MVTWHDMTQEQRDAEDAEWQAERAAELTERRDRAWANRRLIAGRWHWPDGALGECERVERLHPDWAPWWQPANAWAGRPAGFTARRHQYPGEAGVSGATGDELAAAIESAPPRRGLGGFAPLEPLKSD